MAQDSQIARYIAIIESFKVNELQKVLETFHVSKIGKKADLLNRVSSLVRSPGSQKAAIEKIEMVRRGQQSSRHQPYQVPQPPPPPQQQQRNNGFNNYHMRYAIPQPLHYSQGGATMHSGVPGPPRVLSNFTPIVLPFYDVIKVLQAPVELPPVHGNARITSRQMVMFNVTYEMLEPLSYRSEHRPLPRHEVQLRFFNITGDVRGPQPDEFPLNVTVRLDENVVQLPNVIPTNKPQAEPKRPSRPVNVTSYMQPCRADPSRPHRLSIEWSADRRAWAVAVYYVFRVNADILRERLLRNGDHMQSSEATKTEIAKRLGGGDDDEETITMDHLKISLLCPLSKTRMGLPARCRDCTHLQCFDLNSYLQMNEKRPTWKCCVCSGNASYDRLFIDSYFCEILKTVDKSITEVELKKDGSYDVIREEVHDLSDSEDERPKATKASATIDDDIIVLSDSDDDHVSAAIELSMKGAPKSKDSPFRRSDSQQTDASSSSSGSNRTPTKTTKATKATGTTKVVEVITIDDSPPRYAMPAAPFNSATEQQKMIATEAALRSRLEARAMSDYTPAPVASRQPGGACSYGNDAPPKSSSNSSSAGSTTQGFSNGTNGASAPPTTIGQALDNVRAQGFKNRGEGDGENGQQKHLDAQASSMAHFNPANMPMGTAFFQPWGHFIGGQSQQMMGQSNYEQYARSQQMPYHPMPPNGMGGPRGVNIGQQPPPPPQQQQRMQPNGVAPSGPPNAAAEEMINLSLQHMAYHQNGAPPQGWDCASWYPPANGSPGGGNNDNNANGNGGPFGTWR